MQRLAMIVFVVVLGNTVCPSRGVEPSKVPGPAPKFTVVTTASHCDWSWGHSRAWHEERYAQVIHNVLMLMREHPHYIWQLENENEELRPFLAKAGKQWPGLVEEFWQRVREGRIEVIVAITNPRLSEVYPELTVRNLVLGKEYFRRHAPGLKQPVYHAVDLMVGHSQMPQILALADYQYFMFSRPCQKRAVFWRTGLDGTRMLCALQHYAYKGVSPNGIALESYSGDDILPSPELAKEAETWNSSQKVLATSARFFEEVEKAGGTIPELKGVLDSLESFCCGTGLHGNRSLYSRSNQHEDLLLSIEKAQVMASAAGARFSRQAMDELWHDVLSCVGHAILWCWKDDYDERSAKVQQTRVKAEQALQEALAAVARAIRYRSGLGAPLVVFNFQGWPVSGPVEFAFEGDPAGLVLRDGAGAVIPMQLAADQTGSPNRTIAFLAEQVPACGFKTYYLSRAADQPGPARPAIHNGPGSIDNALYRIELLPDGSLRTFHKGRGTPLGSDKEGGLGQLVFYDAPRPSDWMMNGPLGARHVWEPRPDGFQFSQGPVYAWLRAAGTFGPHAATREVRLWHASRRIDYHVAIDAREGCGVFFLRFPLEAGGRVFAGIPFGAEPRENFDQEPFRGEYFAQGFPDAYYATRWTDVSNDQFGYTFIAPHGMHNGYQYKAQPPALEFALLRVRPMPGGIWGQVHPSIQGQGHHRWQCALVPHDKSWQDAATYRDAMELHVPLVAFSPAAGLGRIRLDGPPPVSGQSFDDAASAAEVSPTSVVLSTLRRLESAGAGQPTSWELRVYETLGRATDAVIRLGTPVASAEPTNLLGERLVQPGEIRVAGNEIRLRIPPWKIVTLRVRPATSATP